MSVGPIAGSASLFINGASFPMRGEWEYTLSVDKRETMVGLDAVHGQKVTPGVGNIKGKITNFGNISIAALAASGIDVVLNLVTGKTVTGKGMWTTEQPNASADDGTITVTWESDSVIEQPT